MGIAHSLRSSYYAKLESTIEITSGQASEMVDRYMTQVRF